MVDGHEMVTTTDELLAWVALIPERHQRQGDHRCSCGWEMPGVPWDEHAAGGPIHDLSEFVSSRTSDKDGPVSCDQLETDLYDCIDLLHQYQDVLSDTLLAIALGRPNPSGIAAAVLCKMWPRSVWAAAVHDAGIPVDLDLAVDAPSDV